MTALTSGRNGWAIIPQRKRPASRCLRAFFGFSWFSSALQGARLAAEALMLGYQKLSARAEAIVSGDADLHALGSYQGIPVLSPADCLKRITA